jgi:hypothetical protein
MAQDAHSTARQRILASIHGDKVAVDRKLREFSHDDNDPIFILFAEVLGHQRLSRKQHEEGREILNAIYHPRTWKKLLVLRVVSWLVIPAVLSVGFFALLNYQVNSLSTEQLKIVAGVTRDKETIGKFAQALQLSANLARDARANSESLMAFGLLLHSPGLSLTREGNGYRISGNNLRLEDGPDGPSIYVPGDTLKTILYKQTREDSSE